MEEYRAHMTKKLIGYVQERFPGKKKYIEMIFKKQYVNDDIIKMYPAKKSYVLWRLLSHNRHVTSELHEKYEDKPWDDWALADNIKDPENFEGGPKAYKMMNPNATFDFLLQENEMFKLSYHKDLTKKYVEDNMGAGWDYEHVIKRFDISIEKHLKVLMKVWEGVWWNKRTTMDIIEKMKPINFSALSCNPNLTVEFIEANPGKWDYYSLSCFTEDFAEKHLKRINPVAVAKNKNISLEFVEKYFSEAVSHSPHLTVDYIESSDKIYNADDFIDNDNIPTDFIVDYALQHGQTLFNLSKRKPSNDILLKGEKLYVGNKINYDLALDYDAKYGKRKGNELWEIFSARATAKEINESVNARWNYACLSRNPNLPFEFFEMNIDKKWSWIDICANQFKMSAGLHE